jgi:hypothetical protein
MKKSLTVFGLICLAPPLDIWGPSKGPAQAGEPGVIFAQQQILTDNGTTISTPPGKTVTIGKTLLSGTGSGGSIGRSIEAKVQDQVSVLDYAACDGKQDDTANIQGALNAHATVTIPAGSTCVLRSTGGGLSLATNNRLAGTNEGNSVILVTGSWGASYDFAANGRFANIVVTGNSGNGGTGTINLSWPHLLAAGASVTTSGSGVGGLNGTFKVVSVTTPASFTIATPASVPNGSYTDLTHVSAITGVNSSLIRCVTRDDGKINNFCGSLELDHLHIVSIGAGPFVFIDETGVRNSSFHDLYLLGDKTGDGQILFNLADRTMTGNQPKTSFFNMHYNIEGRAQEFVHISSYDGNTGAGTFVNIAGNARIGLDGYGTRNNSMGEVFERWYLASDSDPQSYWIAGTVPANSFYVLFGLEGATNSPTGYAANVGNFAFVPATPGYIINFPNVTVDSLRINPLSGSGNAFACLDPAGKLYRSPTPCN